MYKWLLRPHGIKKHSQGDFVHKCRDCDYKSNTLSHIKEHIKTKHLGIRYQRDICEQLFTAKNRVKDHKATKHGLALFCSVPGCKFKTAYEFQMKKHHQEKHFTISIIEDK